jgi:hypothetical protein
MLWRVEFQPSGTTGYVEVGTGKLYTDAGVLITGKVSYAATDLNPLQPGWYVPTPLPPAEVPRRIRRLFRAAFRDRFTDAEKQALEIAALDQSGATQVVRNRQARLRAFLQDVVAADRVDLDRPSIRVVVLAMETIGVLSAGRALQILDTDGTPDEGAVE